MIALDTETTGVDFRHGCRPFFVTVCDEDGNQRFWEWSVNPLTRMPEIPESDLAEIKREVDVVRNWGDGFDDEVRERHCIVMQNGKFDVHALKWIGLSDFPWGMLNDTLIAGHVLGSNHRLNLTDQAMRYLGLDIEEHELRMEAACKEARGWCRTNRPSWQIAREGHPMMPSAREGTSGGKKAVDRDKVWKNDFWLPKAVAVDQEFAIPDQECEHKWRPDHHCSRCKGHRWHLLLRDYANADSAVTIALWQVMRRLLEDRNLTKIYRERMRVIPIAWSMEDRGITASSEHLAELKTEYAEESARLERVCVNVAADHGYELQPPKNGRSENLDRFVFDVLKMPVVERTETGAPAMNKKAIDGWVGMLPPTDQRHLFIRSLRNKRSRDTAITYLNGYERFWLPVNSGSLDADESLDRWRVLHPNLNPTGSDTLRWSSNNPNEQNISKRGMPCPSCWGSGKTRRGEKCEHCGGKGEDPRTLRYVFGPVPGREQWSLDAKNIELRIPAFESKQQELIDLLERMDEPPYYGSEHLLNFSTVYPDIWEAELREVGIERVGPHCKKKYAATNYQWCKNGDFAIGYGCGRRMADTTFRRDGAYDMLKARFAKKEALNQKQIAFARRHGYVETIPDRSVDPERGYPLLVSRSAKGEVIPTTPLNYHVSGTAMWWTMRAMIECQEQLDEWRRDEDFDGRIAMQVHDELVFDFPAGLTPRNKDDRRRGCNLWRIKQLQRLMERCGEDIDIPTPVGIEYHQHTWSEGITL